VAGTTTNDALTPTNVRVIPQTSFGSSPALPVRAGQTILFAQRSGDPDNAGRKLREMGYQYEQDSFNASDLSVFSEHITGSGIAQLAYQVDPDSILWGRRSDGTLCAVTYEREQQVVAWHDHAIAGTAAVVDNIASLPGADGDELWIETARTINGGTKRYIEVSAPAMRDDTDKEDGLFLDSALTYEGASTSTVTGLFHLEGETVDVLNNGAVERDKTVASGAITLTNASGGGPVHVGLRYRARLRTLDLEAGAQAGTAQSRKAKLGDIFIRLHRSLGGQVVGVHTDDLEYRFPADPMGSSPPLFSGLKSIAYPGGWTPDEGDEDSDEPPGRIIELQHDDPLPFFVTGMVADVTTSG
jgi:hypothetical protein